MSISTDRRALGNNRRPDNEYRIEGDIAFIRLRSKKGDYEVKIDAEDLERVIARGRWNLVTAHGRYYYATTYSGGANAKTYLHRFLTNAPKGRSVMVDHLNGDTLDCRKANLRVVPFAENARHTWHKRVRACPHCQLCEEHRSAYLSD